jgi:hypothetical protein
MISQSFSPHFSKAQDCDHFTSWLTLPSQVSSPAHETGSTNMTGNTQNCFWNLVANEYQRLIITFVILDQKLQRAVLYISRKWQTCRSVYMGRLPKCKMYNEKGEYMFCWSHRCVSFSICIDIATLSDATTISLTNISFCTHEECSV